MRALERPRLGVVWPVLAVTAALACTGAAPSIDPEPGHDGSAREVSSAPTPAFEPPLEDAGLVLSDDSLGHGPEPTRMAPLLADLGGKVVLHAGDSMVGGQAGLTRALEARFKEAGVKAYKSDSWVSANLSMFHQQPRFGDLLKKHEPDLVILTLGANDSFTSAPEQLVSHVKAIVARIGSTPCLWISPPAFTKAGFPHAAENFQKFVDMLRDHTAPCRFFDTRSLEIEQPDGGTATSIPRAKDRIHPTDKGGAVWADAVWNEHFASQR